MSKALVAVVADMHIMSTVGLIKPNVELDDGGSYKASKGQRWLNRKFIDFCDTAKALKKKHNVELTTIFNGDIVESDSKMRSNQIISRNIATILKIAHVTAQPILDISDTVFVIRGTGAHTGKSGSLEEAFASDITIAEPEPNTNNASWWRLLAEFGGVLFDIEHHGSMGYRSWTSTNALNRLAAELIIEYASNKMRIPDIACRSHYHRKGDTFDDYCVRVLATPAWQLATEYVRRLGKVQSADIGGYFFLCEDGSVEVIKKIYEPTRRKIWRKNSLEKSLSQKLKSFIPTTGSRGE